jgi:U3 small nucleolar RNA-associated protein 13
VNYLSLHDYKRAIELALSMEQPGRLLSLFQELRSSFKAQASTGDLTKTGNVAVDEAIRTLALSDLARLLRYVRNWNANAKTSTVAQDLLYAIMKLRSVEDVIKAFNSELAKDGSVAKEGSGPTALKELVDALIPYTERHLSRLEKLVQESYVVDYILAEMDDGMFDWADGSVVGTSMDVDVGVET